MIWYQVPEDLSQMNLYRNEIFGSVQAEIIFTMLTEVKMLIDAQVKSSAFPV